MNPFENGPTARSVRLLCLLAACVIIAVTSGAGAHAQDQYSSGAQPPPSGSWPAKLQAQLDAAYKPGVSPCGPTVFGPGSKLYETGTVPVDGVPSCPDRPPDSPLGRDGDNCVYETPVACTSPPSTSPSISPPANCSPITKDQRDALKARLTALSRCLGSIKDATKSKLASLKAQNAADILDCVKKDIQDIEDFDKCKQEADNKYYAAKAELAAQTIRSMDAVKQQMAAIQSAIKRGCGAQTSLDNLLGSGGCPSTQSP